MKKTIIASAILLQACTTLTNHEKSTLRSLQSQGISVETPAGNWQAPNSPAAAGLLNLLPGVGNFYLGSGSGADSSQTLYGFLNLLTWPISVVWGVPEAAIDANNLNKRELIYFYTHEEQGKIALEDKGLMLNNRGMVVKK